MTEKEKMMSGSEFYTGDPELMKDKATARMKASSYNELAEDDPEVGNKRISILRSTFAKVGDGSFIKPPFHCDYGYQISVGEHFFANFDCVFLDAGKIVIGDHCMLGPGTCIAAVTHPIDPVSRSQGVGIPQDVVLGNNVWTGANVTILPGVTLGDNVVVGGGSVVTKSFPDNVVIAGNPARIIKEVHIPDLH